MSNWADEVQDMANQVDVIARFIVENDGGVADLLLPKEIHDGFMRLAAPSDIEASAQMAHDLKSAQGATSLNIHDVVTSSEDLMDGWSGAAASSFVEYLGQIESAVEAQARVLDGFTDATKVFHGIVSGMQSDLGSLVQAAAKGLNEANLSPEEIGVKVLAAFGSVGSGSVVGGILATGELAIAYTSQANARLEVLYALSEGLNSLHEIATGSLEKVAKAYKWCGQYVLDNALTLNPPGPSLVTEKAFDPDRFSVDLPAFERQKAKVSHGDLVPEPVTLLPDPIDVVLEEKRAEEAKRRKEKEEELGGP